MPSIDWDVFPAIRSEFLPQPQRVIHQVRGAVTDLLHASKFTDDSLSWLLLLMI